MQRLAPEGLGLSPSLVFDGLTSDDNNAAFGFRVAPPDTSGDVGPNHYVQAVNLLLRVFDKAGRRPHRPAHPGEPLHRRRHQPRLRRSQRRRTDRALRPARRPLAGEPVLHGGEPVRPPAHRHLADGGPHGGLLPLRLPDAEQQVQRELQARRLDRRVLHDRPPVQPGRHRLPGHRRLRLRPRQDARRRPDRELRLLRRGDRQPDDRAACCPPTSTACSRPRPGTPGYFAYFTADELADPAHPFDSLRVFELRPSFTNPAASTFAERADSPLAGGGLRPALARPGVPTSSSRHRPPAPRTSTPSRTA